MTKLRLLTLLMLSNVSVAWDVDKRCPNWRNGRELQVSGGIDVHDASVEATAHETKQRATSSLRGPDEQGHRELSSSFQLKMYWEQGFCWQEEWKERKWCVSCQGSCSRGERLWIQYCSDGDAIQKFNYIPGTGGGQLKTVTENLCLESVSSNSFKLETCQNTDRQIFTGFTSDGSPFELHPKSTSNTCLTNEFHHPKPDEFVYGTNCAAPRKDHTNKWHVYNWGSNIMSQPKASYIATNNVFARLRGPGCSKSRPCGLCSGDCDNDDECEGNLICFQKSGPGNAPGCSGYDVSKTDFCISP